MFTDIHLNTNIIINLSSDSDLIMSPYGIKDTSVVFIIGAHFSLDIGIMDLFMAAILTCLSRVNNGENN